MQDAGHRIQDVKTGDIHKKISNFPGCSMLGTGCWLLHKRSGLEGTRLENCLARGRPQYHLPELPQYHFPKLRGTAGQAED